MLRKRYKYLEKNGDDVELDRKHYTPEEILEQVKHGTLTKQATENSDEKSCSDLPQNQTTEGSTEMFPSEKQLHVENEHSSNETTKIAAENQFTAQTVLAPYTLRDKGIPLVPEKQCFLVKSSISGNKCAVTLFLKETCQCPSTARCNHIIMARIAIGLDADDGKKKVVNSDALRKHMSRQI